MNKHTKFAALMMLAGVVAIIAAPIVLLGKPREKEALSEVELAHDPKFPVPHGSFMAPAISNTQQWKH
jgi:hypothetical protein